MASIDAPLTDLSVAIAGPGKVGLSLGVWLQAAGASVRWIVGRGIESTTNAAELLKAEPIRRDQLFSRDWDLLLVSLPDSAIADWARSIVTEIGSGIEHGGIALHTSGSQSAEALTRLRALGVKIGSLHPLLSFPDLRLKPPEGIVYGFDGDPQACQLAVKLARAFSGQSVPIADQNRLLYHYCATLAAGGVSTVLALIDELSAEMSLTDFRAGFLRLSQEAVLAAVSSGDAASTITGPIARRDLELANRQLSQAEQTKPAATRFLRALHKETLRQTHRAATESAVQQDLLAAE